MTSTRLNIFYQNTRGLRTKLPQFYRSIETNNFDIIIITESWLCDGILDTELCDNRYDVFRYDRPASQMGGGVLICIKRCFSAMARLDINIGRAESVWITINSNDKYQGSVTSTRRTHIAAVYLPPNNNLHFMLNDFKNLLLMQHSINPDDTFLIIGDFNLPCIKWTVDGRGIKITSNSELGMAANDFIDCLDYVGFCQYNLTPNCCRNVLDLVLTNSTLECICKQSVTSLVDIDKYHIPLDINIHAQVFKPIRPQPRNIRRFFRGDYDKINEELLKVNWEQFFNSISVEEMVDKLYLKLKSLIDSYVPSARVSGGHCYPKWYPPSLINAIKEKFKVHRRWKKYNNPNDYAEFSLLRKRIKDLQEEFFTKYIDRTEEQIKFSPQEFWNYIKSRRKTSGYPCNMTYDGVSFSNGEDICNAFNDFFHSVFQPYDPADKSTTCSESSHSKVVHSITVSHRTLKTIFNKLDIKKGAGTDGLPVIFIKKCEAGLTTPLQMIFQKSLNDGIFPKQWKDAQIVPIHKKGPKNNITNYRPVSLLNNFGKMLEKVVYEHIYTVSQHCIPVTQHGFVQSRSVNTNLLNLTDYVISNMNTAQIDVVYTDFEKAFDRVNYSILISKLYAVGIKGNLLRWLESYLRNRRQAVVIGGYRSDFVDVTSGVPQGSLLSPLLYNIYLFDIPDCFHHSKHLLYADDKKIFRKIENIGDCLLLQSDLNRLTTYYQNNKINVNTQKCQIISFTRKKHPISYEYRICNETIPRTSQVRDLGVILDSKFTFRAHIDHIISKAYKSLGFVIRNSKPFKDLQCLKMLYFSYVRSILEFANIIWRPFFKIHINNIESIQHKFIKHLNYKAKLVNKSYEESCAYHKINTLEDRRQLSDMLFLFDIINNKFDCSEFIGKIFFNVPSRRTRHTQLLMVPSARTKYYKMSPYVRIPAIYNSYFSSLDPFNTSRASYKKYILISLSQNVP